MLPLNKLWSGKIEPFNDQAGMLSIYNKECSLLIRQRFINYLDLERNFIRKI